jgi:hypothetical protein
MVEVEGMVEPPETDCGGVESVGKPSSVPLARTLGSNHVTVVTERYRRKLSQRGFKVAFQLA